MKLSVRAPQRLPTATTTTAIDQVRGTATHSRAIASAAPSRLPSAPDQDLPGATSWESLGLLIARPTTHEATSETATATVTSTRKFSPHGSADFTNTM